MLAPIRLLLPLLLLAVGLAGCGRPAGSAATATPAPSATVLPASATPVPAATVLPASATPVPAATALPASATPVPAATALPASATPVPAATPAPATVGAQILFLRGGALVALDVASGAQRPLADDVRAFAATADGRRLAVVRGAGPQAEIWLLERDGSGLRQLTTNQLVESTLSWAPDSLALAYSAAPAAPPALPEWPTWSAWCASAEVRVVDVASGAEQTLAQGCEPAFAPDGRRIAFATPPGEVAEGYDFRGAGNSIRIVNRQGQNGWDVARGGGRGETDGYVVYAPSWAPDGARVAYQRFLGYHSLVDINLTEMSSSFQRQNQPIGQGAGWMLPPQYAPDSNRLAVTEYNYSDARGFDGYDIWSTAVLRLGAAVEMDLPFARLTMAAAELDHLTRATAAAWSPDGTALAVVLPAGWTAGLSNNEPHFAANTPGELWRWRPGNAPETRLAVELDFGSPVLWLPALPPRA